MAKLFAPKVFLIVGGIFWSLLLLFHLYIPINETPNFSVLYMSLLGLFLFSFYNYFDLLYDDIGQKNIFYSIYKLFINSLKITVPILFVLFFEIFEISSRVFSSEFFQIFIYNFSITTGFVFLLMNFVVFKRLIFFESSAVMRSIFMFFQIGVFLIFISDLLYNFFPSDNYQYLLAVIFMLGGVLFFNQKWIAYMHFDQKWKTILIFLFLLSFIVLIYIIISFDQSHSMFYFDIKSSLIFILLMAFNFTYLSVSILISTFNLPTSPVFDKIQNESYLARKVQENLIPVKLPNSKKLKLSSYYMPHFALGGDYFDYIELSKDKFLISIADVSGKGIPAALLMSNVQACLRTMTRQTEDIKKIVEELNFQISLRGLSERFVSIFLCIYDLKNKTLQYINCGHPHPLLFFDNKVEELSEGSTVLGMFEKLPQLNYKKISNISNFNLFCYTDGITEAKNNVDDYYGSSRLKNLFASKIQTSPAFVSDVIEDLNNFKGKKITDDDITLLLASVNNE